MLPLPWSYSIITFCFVLFSPSLGEDCISSETNGEMELTCNGTAGLPKTPNSDIIQLQLKDFPLPRLEEKIFTNLPDLTYFYADNLGIETIDSNAFKKLGLLFSVTMRKNNISEIDSNLVSDSSLYYFNIEYNTGLILPKGKPFLNSTSLDQISLKACGLREISAETFDLLPNLRTIDLSNNFLTALPDNAFQNNKDLFSLDLEKNKFTTLAPTSFESKSNVRVYLAGNPWNCDCHLTPLILWAKSNKYPPSNATRTIDTGICEKPNNMTFDEVVDPTIC